MTFKVSDQHFKEYYENGTIKEEVSYGNSKVA